MIAGKILLVWAVLCLSGCVINTTPTGPLQYDSFHLDRDRAEVVNVRLNMGAGKLQVGSGTEKLLQAYFTYNVPAWKPVVRYESGTLTIDQGKTGHVNWSPGQIKYEWDLRFGRDAALDFDVNFGAGEAQLDLGSLNLRSVKVQMGVGSLNLDLRGRPQHDYDVHIHGGIGEAVVRLPSSAGVYANARGGIGEIKARGLTKQGDHWENDAYGTAKVNVHVDVEGGIGSVTLIDDSN
ncbi:MAG TPA: toast rack family protein [Candidatus Nitrosotalea sp.]|nr:toast rack family protein [Candidatus Nitrosotalea sp.]